VTLDGGMTDALAARLTEALAGRLEIGEVLGVGGFGVVFKAHDPLLQRDVAIKALHPGLVQDPASAERLLDEARLVATAERLTTTSIPAAYPARSRAAASRSS